LQIWKSTRPTTDFDTDRGQVRRVAILRSHQWRDHNMAVQ
jgi:hypothetical protein